MSTLFSYILLTLHNKLLTNFGHLKLWIAEAGNNFKRLTFKFIGLEL